MATLPESGITYRAAWARKVVRGKLAEELNALQAQGQHQDSSGSDPTTMSLDGLVPAFRLPVFTGAPITPDNLPPDVEQPNQLAHDRPSDDPMGLEPDGPDPNEQGKHHLCIIGAGVAGLYIAMILDSLEIPNLTYEILEASERTGGRLYTHYFSKEKHQYYDIGAMRFPHIGIMDRTFDLFKRLDIPLIPYYLSNGSKKCPTMFNDLTTVDGDKVGFDPYHVSEANKGSVPDETVRKGVDGLLEEAFGPYKKLMQEDFSNGFKELMKVDEYSTREFLKNPPPPPQPKDPAAPRNPQPKKLDFFSIQWLETNDTSSGLFDQGFSESVMDSFDFDAPSQNGIETWSCIEGGTSLVSDRMEQQVKEKVQHNKRVNKISQEPSTNNLNIRIANDPKPYGPYTTVFNTTTLGCLQRMDLTEMNLHPSQKDAIRALHYDDSAKVAIRFKYPWWITECGITSGGAASTDIPLRTCVYPSYNIHDPTHLPSILLVSYTWAQDATRIGSLVSNDSPANESELLELMLTNLARLHKRNYNQTFDPDMTLDQVRARIAAAYDSHHAYSWTKSAWTSGAFALFGPAQFTNLYPYLSRPSADARFHICGEASSAHHAWIVGSLNSAYAAVHKFLRRFGLWVYIWKLKKLWGEVEEIDDGRDGFLHWQVFLGMLGEKDMVRV